LYATIAQWDYCFQLNAFFFVYSCSILVLLYFSVARALYGRMSFILVTLRTCMNAVVIHISLDKLRESSVFTKFVVLSYEDEERSRHADRCWHIRQIVQYILLYVHFLLYYHVRLLSYIMMTRWSLITIINCYIIRYYCCYN